MRLAVLFPGGHNDVGFIKAQHGDVAHQRHMEYGKELQHGEHVV